MGSLTARRLTEFNKYKDISKISLNSWGVSPPVTPGPVCTDSARNTRRGGPAVGEGVGEGASLSATHARSAPGPPRKVGQVREVGEAHPSGISESEEVS